MSILTRYRVSILTKYSNIKDTLTPKFPKRFEGTFVERWANFWKNLSRDYIEVGKDAIKDTKERPKRAVALAWGFAGWLYCVKTNPSAQSFRDQVVSMTTQMALIPRAIRRKESSDHLVFLESCYNAGTIRRLNVGIASFMWVDNYDLNVGSYASQCKYLKPEYVTFYKRIVDIGFLGRWWLIEKEMKDYDINPLEWEKVKM